MNKTTKLVIIFSFLFVIFIFFLCLFLIDLSNKTNKEINTGDYITTDYCIAFEVPDYYKEGLEITTLDPGTPLFVPKPYDELYCEMANDNGEVFPGSQMMCLVEFDFRNELVQGWVMKSDIQERHQDE